MPDSGRLQSTKDETTAAAGARPAEYRRPDFAAAVVSLSLPS